MIGLVLRLYPRRYRAECGEEITAVYQQVAVDAPAVERFREATDIAAHAVRMRCGLSSTTAAGRLLARAAPLAVASAAVYGGVQLSQRYAEVVATPSAAHYFLDAWTVLLLAAVLLFVGAVTALTGRWSAGAVAVVLGLTVLAVAAVVSGPAFDDPILTPAMALLTAVVVAGCPPDLRPGPSACAVAGVLVVAAWLPVTAMYAGALPVTTDYGLWPLLVLAATGLAQALWSRSSGLAETAAVIAACPLFLALAYTKGAWGPPLSSLGLVAVVPLACALAAGAQALRLRGWR